MEKVDKLPSTNIIPNLQQGITLETNTLKNKLVNIPSFANMQNSTIPSITSSPIPNTSIVQETVPPNIPITKRLETEQPQTNLEKTTNDLPRL